MYMLVISSAREATAAIHAWAKLHAQIMSWFLRMVFMSAVYVQRLPEAPHVETLVVFASGCRRCTRGFVLDAA